MLIKQISVFVENKTGRLQETTQVLADAGVNIRALSIADTADFGILRMIVDKPDAAQKALNNASMTMSISSVLALCVEDIPGGFNKAVKVLSDNDISIEYMYAFNTEYHKLASIIIRVNDNQKAIKVLKEADMQLLEGCEIYE